MRSLPRGGAEGRVEKRLVSTLGASRAAMSRVIRRSGQTSAPMRRNRLPANTPDNTQVNSRRPSDTNAQRRPVQVLRMTSSYNARHRSRPKPLSSSFSSKGVSQGNAISNRLISLQRRSLRTAMFNPQRDLHRTRHSAANRRLGSAIRQRHHTFPPGRQVNLERSRSSQRALAARGQQRVLDSGPPANQMVPSMVRLRSRLGSDQGRNAARLAKSGGQRDSRQLADSSARLRSIQRDLMTRLQHVNRLQQQIRNRESRRRLEVQSATDPSALTSRRQTLDGGTRVDRPSLRERPQRGFHAGNPPARSLRGFLDDPTEASFVGLSRGNSARASQRHGVSQMPPSSSVNTDDFDGRTAEQRLRMQTVQYSSRQASDHHSLTGRHHPLSSDLDIDQIIASAYMKKGVDEYPFMSSRATSDGFVLTALDMRLSNQQYYALQPSSIGRRKRKTVAFNKWPNGIIPYEIIPGHFGSSGMELIRWAMDQWQKETCVVFRPATDSDRSKVVIRSGTGCSSYIGMSGGPQAMTLQDKCLVEKIVLHELGHALGLVHEHQRPDRDGFVTINYSHLRPGGRGNFERFSQSYVSYNNVAYDYTSIMHYGPRAFSRSPHLLTIETKDPHYQSVIGKANYMSNSDIKAVNRMYRCGAAKTGTLASATLPLEGQAAGGAPTVRAGVVRTAAEASAGTLSGITLSSQGSRAGVSNFPTRLEFYDTARGKTFNAPFNTRANSGSRAGHARSDAVSGTAASSGLAARARGHVPSTGSVVSGVSVRNSSGVPSGSFGVAHHYSPPHGNSEYLASAYSYAAREAPGLSAGLGGRGVPQSGTSGPSARPGAGSTTWGAAAGVQGYVPRVSSGSTVGAGRPGVQSHAPLSRYSPSADHSRTTSHLQHNSPAGNPLSSHGLQAGPGPAVAADFRHHRLPTHSGSVAMDVHHHSLQSDPGPAVAVDVHGSHGPWRGATQVTVATQEPAAAGRAHKETDGTTGSRQADTGQTPHSAESCRQLLPSACIVKEEQALKMMHGAALVQRCLATALSVCELMKQ